ncbi:MAG: hypothetical protein ACFB22_00355 [Rhodothalassiaceae bacterium]
MRPETHYEVQGLTETGWTVLDTAADEPKAIAAARLRLEDGGLEAVRVTREHFNPESNVFRSSVVYEKEGVRKPAYGGGDVAAPCRTMADLERWEVCQAANIAMRELLDGWGMIASEVFFDYATYKRLADQGGALAGAVTGTIDVMLPNEEQLLPPRAKAVMPVIKEAAARLKRVHESGTIPTIQKNDFFALAIQYEGEEDRLFRMAIAVMRLFRQFDGVEQRLTWLLQRLNPLPAAWSIELVDRWLAECLMHRRLLDAFLEGQASCCDRVLILLRMAEGKLEQDSFTGAKVPEALGQRMRALHAHLVEGRLPKVRDVLIGRAADILVDRAPLKSGEFLQELAAAAHIYRASVVDRQTRTRHGRLGDILVKRCNRLLHSDAIAQFTEKSLDPYPGLMALLELEPIVIGETAKNRLADYMFTIIGPPKRADALRTGDGNPLNRMRELGQLQKRLNQSAMPDNVRAKLAEILDQHSAKLLSETNLFKKMQASKEPGFEKVLRLAKMLCDGYFTEGIASDVARRHVWNFMASRDVIARLIRPPASEQEKNDVATLQKLLAAAGVSGDPVNMSAN